MTRARDILRELRGAPAVLSNINPPVDRLLRDAADEIERLRGTLDKLIKSVIPCPHCPPEAECYVFSMVALQEAGQALEE